MQPSALHHVFTIPELVLLIAEYLSPHEISQWMMTGKAFIRQLEPVLWRHLNINNIDKPYQVPDTMVRYRQYIQSIQAKGSINIYKLLEVMAEGLPPLSTSIDSHAGSTSRLELHRLESLNMDKISGTIENHPVLRLSLVLSHSPNLTQLTIPGVILEQDPLSLESFLFGMATQVPCLQRLVVKGDMLIVATGFSLTEVCLRLPQLIDLELDFEMDKYLSSMNGIHPSLGKTLGYLNDINKSNPDGGEPTGARLKSLRLPYVRRGYPWAFLLLLFRSMIPNIERLDLPRTCDDMDATDVDEIKDIIATCCPKLQNLSTTYHFELKGYHGLINGVLRGCANSGLRTFDGHGYDDEFFRAQFDPVISVLLLYHGRTLEKVELLDVEHVESRSIQSILTTCRNLKTFRVDQYGRNEVSMTFQDAASIEWVCSDITVLQLRLDRWVSVPEGEREEEVLRQAAQRVYAQIGRLVKLEELRLGCEMSESMSAPEEAFSKDLTLEHGWLSELAGLKRLRYFRMDADFWSSMGPLEVEFMDSNWLKLEKSDLVCELHLIPLHDLTPSDRRSNHATDASHRVFAIPELVVLIAKYLSSHEINQWMMTGTSTRAHPLEPSENQEAISSPQSPDS
ncbi:hypothetical protein BGX31_008157, partial [Mortierella sp. GBA43]